MSECLVVVGGAVWSRLAAMLPSGYTCSLPPPVIINLSVITIFSLSNHFSIITYKQHFCFVFFGGIEKTGLMLFYPPHLFNILLFWVKRGPFWDRDSKRWHAWLISLIKHHQPFHTGKITSAQVFSLGATGRLSCGFSVN